MVKNTLIDLNTASARHLKELKLLDESLILEILRRRPFKSWESLKQAFGCDEEWAAFLREHGAILGLSLGPGKIKSRVRNIPAAALK
jgi:hypothetical protein